MLGLVGRWKDGLEGLRGGLLGLTLRDGAPVGGPVLVAAPVLLRRVWVLRGGVRRRPLHGPGGDHARGDAGGSRRHPLRGRGGQASHLLELLPHLLDVLPDVLEVLVVGAVFGVIVGDGGGGGSSVGVGEGGGRDRGGGGIMAVAVAVQGPAGRRAGEGRRLDVGLQLGQGPVQDRMELAPLDVAGSLAQRRGQRHPVDLGRRGRRGGGGGGGHVFCPLPFAEQCGLLGGPRLWP